MSTAELNILASDLSVRLKPALQHWGRCTSTNYPAFQPIVTLRLRSVEAVAMKLVGEEDHPRPIDDSDRQHAVWYLVRRAILSLQPPPTHQPADIRAAMEYVVATGWPRDLAAPPEYHQYLVLLLAYVTKTHANKQIADLFGVSLRSVATIRNQAIMVVSRRLAAGEVSHARLEAHVT